jgi:NAD(P)-dependent dehydrogenase (short-subunit alcohol dehydrogenase family)
VSRRVLVTGGVRGIGLAIAKAFVREHCQVTVTGLTEEDVLTFDSPNIEAVRLNVTDADSVASLVMDFDRLDVLVNCAGIILRDGLEHEIEGFLEVIAVNLSGTTRMCYSCYPLLLESGGCVLNVASMLSFFGSGFVPAYSASKGGIAQLTKSLAIAWAPNQVRVNAIAPGWIETDLTRPLADDPERSKPLIDRTPMGRWGQTDDVSGAAVFLCSPAAAFITGVILPVDGGYSIA